LSKWFDIRAGTGPVAERTSERSVCVWRGQFRRLMLETSVRTQKKGKMENANERQVDGT
jgi:hypothetical protein